MPLNTADIIILVVLAYFVFKGFWNGFLREFASLFGLVAGFFLAKQFSGDLAQFVNFSMSETALYSLSFGAIVIATVIVTGLLASLLSKLLSIIFIGWINNLLGAIFGLLKGLLLIMIITYIILLVLPVPMLETSLFMPYYKQILEYVNSYLNANPVHL